MVHAALERRLEQPLRGRRARLLLLLLLRQQAEQERSQSPLLLVQPHSAAAVAAAAHWLESRGGTWGTTASAPTTCNEHTSTATAKQNDKLRAGENSDDSSRSIEHVCADVRRHVKWKMCEHGSLMESTHSALCELLSHLPQKPRMPGLACACLL